MMRNRLKINLQTQKLSWQVFESKTKGVIHRKRNRVIERKAKNG